MTYGRAIIRQALVTLSVAFEEYCPESGTGGDSELRHQSAWERWGMDRVALAMTNIKQATATKMQQRSKTGRDHRAEPARTRTEAEKAGPNIIKILTEEN